MSTPRQPTPRKPKGRGPGVTAAGFLIAFGLSTATIIYTGLKVGAPRHDAATQQESHREQGAAVAGAATEPGTETGNPSAVAAGSDRADGEPRDGAEPPQ